MRWRFYYANGSTYSDRDGSPFDAPTAGAQVLAFEEANERGFALAHGKAAFVWRDGEWHHVDEAGLWDYLYISRGPKAVIFGRTVRNSAFWALVDQAGREGLG